MANNSLNLTNALNVGNITESEFWENMVRAKHRIGVKYQDNVGRIWRFCSFGEDVAVGKLVQPAAAVEKSTCAAGTAGWYKHNYYSANQIIYDADGSEMTAGAYAGWWAAVIAGTGVGQVARIRDNDSLNLYLEAALGTALSVSNSAVTLFPGNPYKDLVKTTGTSSIRRGVVSGAVQVDVSYATYPYAWILTHGRGIGITDAYNYGVGLPLTLSDATTGNQETWTAGSADERIVSYVVSYGMATATTNYCLVDYCIE